MKLLMLILTLLFFAACTSSPSVRTTLRLADDNRAELEKVLTHYKQLGDKQKIQAAEYLIVNMVNKFCHRGGNIHHYDTIFHLYDSLYRSGIYNGEPLLITNTWEELVKKYGKITPAKLERQQDFSYIQADFLIKNIDVAFEAWRQLPPYFSVDFRAFCEHILPYRAGNEPLEEYRERYFRKYKHLVDTAKSVEGLLAGFNQEFRYNQNYRVSQTLWGYSIGIPVSKMELGHRGACRHKVNFTTLIMRACGLPVASDRVVWANRSQGHEWNVLMLDSGKIFPFDAMDKKRIAFAYQPAKIFRSSFSYDNSLLTYLNPADVPLEFFTTSERDVTAEYGGALRAVVPIQYPYKGEKRKRFGVICTFDNDKWKVVYWGEIRFGKMHFENMMSDVVYLAAYYEEGKLHPAAAPFLLQPNGELHFFSTADSTQAMILQRKYPRFKRIEDFAWGMRRSNAEGANRQDFSDRKIFFSIYDVPFQMAEDTVNSTTKFRYVRLNAALHREANYAEVEFYGKRSLNAPEQKLAGKIIGFPPTQADNLHPYTHAMDGSLETWFGKPKQTMGWVGLDLGKGNEHIVTRVRFCPRSDTNFILEGDTYELYYWSEDGWSSMGEQVATAPVLTYEQVPAGTLYFLKNHSRGKEERIFTYENGKQVWW